MSSTRRNLIFGAFIVLALAAGAATGIYRARVASIKATSSTTSSTTSSDTSNTAAEPTDSKTVESENTAEPVALTPYTPATFNSASTVEALAVNAVNAFEKALNTSDAAAVAGLFAESVDIGTIPVLVSGLKTHPVSVVITGVVARADGSALITVTEKRQNSTGDTTDVNRVFELIPRENDYAVSSYATTESTETFSGFAD